ncbi:hypothetical protein [Priestia aryabhattai]
MFITGKDRTSLTVIDDLRKKTIRLKEIPSKYNISIDQAKRLSRYSKILVKTEKNLSETSLYAVKMLGVKVLQLSQLFKCEDWEGLEEILHIVDSKTRTYDLEALLLALKAKRKE